MILSQIENAFPQCGVNGCIATTTELEFKILDRDEQAPASIHPDGTFQILNPSGKEIQLLAIDKCIFFDGDTFRKCDVGIFDDSVFYFIEIKVVKLRSRSKIRIDAVEQLRSTIKIFKEKVNFSSYTVYAVYSLTNANISPYPAATASKLNREIEFFNATGAELREANQIDIV